jgi:cytochrome c6
MFTHYFRPFAWLRLLLVPGVILFCSSSLAAQEGAPLYNAKCAMCHGKDGSGKTPMGAKLNMTDFKAPVVLKMSDAELKKIVTEGKEKMPSYKAKLTPAQIGSLVAYVRSLQK